MTTGGASSTVQRSASAGPDLSERLQRLTEAAVAINSPLDLRDVLHSLAEHARWVVGAHHAVTSTSAGAGGDWSQSNVTVSLSDKHAELRGLVLAEYASPLYGMVCLDNETVTLTDRELHRLGYAPERPDPHLPLRGWLAVPLVARDGSNLGLVQVSDRVDGDFDAEDRALLIQLAQLASVTIEKARLAERLAAQEAARFREELLSGISHDMQTPLAAIVGLADLLVRDRELGEQEQHEAHQTISRQARALRGLVQQFLDFSRLESERPLLVRPRPTDVVQAIDRVVSLFAHQRDIIVGVARGLPQIDADPDRLDQVLANLVNNAVKYSDGAVRVVARHEGRELLIDVVDEGPGLSEEDHGRLFEKFHRGQSASGTSGTGLGLYITKALVEAQGGVIRVHSNVGVGSRFTVRFPSAGSSA
ncbi:MAG TPA: ATP-binding protein [Nitriliruptorales bacterium]